MKERFSRNDKIGKIAAIYPYAIEIFMKYDIDFCCGGDRPLYEGIQEKNLKEDKIINELNEDYDKFKDWISKEIDWNSTSMEELIDFIINKHHTFMKRELPIINELLTKIFTVHYSDHGEVLSKLKRLFGNLRMEIEEHLIKEEEVLFPILMEYEKNPSKELLTKALKVLHETEDEHDNAGDILKEMKGITDGYKAPSSGCNSFRIAYEKLQIMEEDLFRHIHLENNILFKRIKSIK